MRNSEYFHSDRDNLIEKENYMKQCNSTICKTYASLPDTFNTFKGSEFAEFFTWHFLYFFVLGPLIVLPMAIWKKYILARNMGFYGCTRGFFLQIPVYTVWVTVATLYFTGIVEINRIYILNFFYLTALRCMTIGMKYAFLGEEKLEMIKNRVIKPEFLEKD